MQYTGLETLELPQLSLAVYIKENYLMSVGPGIFKYCCAWNSCPDRNILLVLVVNYSIVRREQAGVRECFTVWYQYTLMICKKYVNNRFNLSFIQPS